MLAFRIIYIQSDFRKCKLNLQISTVNNKLNVFFVVAWFANRGKNWLLFMCRVIAISFILNGYEIKIKDNGLEWKCQCRYAIGNLFLF